MTHGVPPRSRLFGLVPLMLPVVAGWAVGFFLREVQASVVPYDVFMILGSLAGQLQFVTPQRIPIGSQIGVVALWLFWSWLLHRRTREPFPQSLCRDALSYLPLLLLPSIALLVDHPRLQPLKYLLDPLVICVVAAVCAIKSWQWSRATLPSDMTHPPSAARWVWILFIASAAMFATLGVLQYHAWNVAHESSGTLEEMLWKTLHGQFLCTGYFGCNYLGYHVQLIELLWLPLYALWPSMDCVTILQAIALAAGVFPVWWLARQKWDDRRALWFPLLYLLQPSLHFAFSEVCYNTYRPEAFLIPIALFGVFFLERERWLLAALCGFLLLITREEMGVVVAAAGVYVALAKRRHAVGAALTVFGIAYLLFCMFVVIPHFNPQSVNTRLNMVTGVGAGDPVLAFALQMEPGALMNRLFDPMNLLYLAYLIAPLGLLCCGRPSVALLSLPLLVAAMWIGGGIQNSIYFHYHNAQFALLMAAVPSGAAAIATRWANTFRCTPRRAQSLVLAFAVSAALVSTLIGSKIPLSVNFYYPSISPFHYSALYQRTPHTQALERIQSRIPRESKVVATLFAATHFVRYAGCNAFPSHMDEADFMVVDMNARWKKGAQADLRRWGEQGPPGFDLLWVEDGVFVFRRKPATNSTSGKGEAATEPGAAERERAFALQSG